MRSLNEICWIASASLAILMFAAQVRAQGDAESSYLQGMELLEADSLDAAAALFDAAIALPLRTGPHFHQRLHQIEVSESG